MTPSRRASASGAPGEDGGPIGNARSVGKVAATKAAERAPAGGGASGRNRKAASTAPAAAPRTTRTTTKDTVSSAVTQTSSTTDKDDKDTARAKDAAPSEKKQAPAPKAATTRNGSAAAQPAPGGRAAASKKAPPKKPGATATGSPANGAGPYAHDARFLAEQRELLDHERVVYESQASDLKAEADSLAQEREPGDVQFDEESGEGGTVTVDRERDLALSAQATAAVEEIDAALRRIDDGTYGACERCHQAIPKPRLKALPFARLCVACKSGGLSRR